MGAAEPLLALAVTVTSKQRVTQINDGKSRLLLKRFRVPIPELCRIVESV